MSIYAPGRIAPTGRVSTVEPTRHVFEAITTRGRPVALQFADPNLGETPAAEGWQLSHYPCTPSFRSTGQQCDEYPYSSSRQMGPDLAPTYTDPGGVSVETPAETVRWAPWVYNGASIRMLDGRQNNAAGGSYGGFVRGCPGLKVGTPVDRPYFLVLPMPGEEAPKTWSLCRDLVPGQ
jgi:hypothetical protein